MRTALIAPLLLAACGGTPDEDDVPAFNLASNGVPVAADADRRPDARGPGTALGLTQLQLEQAQLVDPAGARLGEVEKVELDGRGDVRALRIELDDSIAVARVVRIGLDGLSPVRTGPRWDLRTAAARDRLAALPPALS